MRGTDAPNRAFAGLVDSGQGCTMYLECRGSGTPTVVFVSGLRFATDQCSMTADRASASVFAEVDRVTRARVYDRPGAPRVGRRRAEVRSSFSRSRLWVPWPTCRPC
jgi:hypothetical protein